MNARKELPEPQTSFQTALRRRYSRADGSADAPTGEPTGGPADAPTDTRADAPARAAARKARSATGAAERPARARTAPAATQRPQESLIEPQRAVQPPRRELDVAGRSYRAGLDKLQPRTDRLVAAVRAMLAAGATRAEVLGSLAEVGLTPRDLPQAVTELLPQ